MACPNCGKKSLSEMVDHSCRLCAKDYEYCVKCIIDWGTEPMPGSTLRLARTAGIEHEVEDE